MQGDPLLKGFADYENRVLAIRDRFFVDKEFNYVRQANIPWKLLGPIPNGGKTEKEFAPEEDNKAGKMRDSYEIDGVTYEWSGDDYTGATIIFKHYCDFPTLFNGAKMGAYPHKTTLITRRPGFIPPRRRRCLSGLADIPGPRPIGAMVRRAFPASGFMRIPNFCERPGDCPPQWKSRVTAA